VPLSIRPKVYSLPSYSLTGDLLGFLRCGLQYRYTRIGKLPASRPVQQWFGEFIHGVLEEAFRRYRESVKLGQAHLPPWPESELTDIQDLIKARLAARGLIPWAPDVEDLGCRRADAAIQELGPHLFPLIHRAEVRLTGARMLPQIQAELQFREADRYEIIGVIDVVTHVQLNDPALQGNPIVQAILHGLPQHPPGQFEVIIDYKGTRRPPIHGSFDSAPGLWSQYAWQLQTYGELRRRQPDALPVVAGVLVYINELLPTRSDIEHQKLEIMEGTTDILPPLGSEARGLLEKWTTKSKPPVLPFDYRLERTLQVHPIDAGSIQTALQEFDAVVGRIESCRGHEIHGTPVLAAWEKNWSDESTCAVCDWRTFCPAFQANYAAKRGETKPRLPGVTPKS
jgi:hypothetical protein